MTTPETQNHVIEVGSLPPVDQPDVRDTEPLHNGLYTLSLLLAGVAILFAFLAAIAAWSDLPNLAAAAVWGFVVATGLWLGGVVYILSVSWRHFWRRLHRKNNDPSAG